MKKTLIVLFSGILFATAGSVYAEEIATMVGKKVQGEFPVKVNGEQLEKTAIVIDGTSYLPVRAIGDALDMDIKFDADLGIELNDKEEMTMESAAIEISPEDAEVIRTSEEQIQKSQSKIEEHRTRIAELDKKISETQDPIEIEIWTNQKETAQSIIDMNQTAISQLQTYIDKIKAKYQTP